MTLEATMTDQRTLGSVESVAAGWLVAVWILAAVNAVAGFVLFGYAFATPSTSMFARNGDTTFNGAAGIGGAVGVVLLYLPWVGVLTVLRAMARQPAPVTGR